jgi:ABC-type dipeptide/oligopeptide/nickel transport system permease component
MAAYIVRRLLFLPVILFAVSFITFTLFRLVPGDPVVVMLGPKYRPAVAEQLREQLGLKRPFLVQYGDYMWGFVRLDFGESFVRRGVPVRDLILPKMWLSVRLAASAMAISIAIGLPLGFLIAHKQGSWIDPAVVTVTLVLMAVPIMVTLPVLLLTFCLKLHWVPCSGWTGGFDSRILVPAVGLGIIGIAGLARLMRASTLDVLGQDFIRTAHAKGLSPVQVDRRHVFKNAMIPIVTILAFSLAGLIGGSFIVERIMGIPGIGGFFLDSIFQRDFPVTMAITLIGAIFFVLANLLADLTYAYLDPRIRYR